MRKFKDVQIKVAHIVSKQFSKYMRMRQHIADIQVRVLVCPFGGRGVRGVHLDGLLCSGTAGSGVPFKPTGKNLPGPCMPIPAGMAVLPSPKLPFHCVPMGIRVPECKANPSGACKTALLPLPGTAAPCLGMGGVARCW